MRIAMPAARTFLSNVSLAIFAFLITNAGAIAVNTLGWLYIYFFFLLVKSIIWGQQLQVY